MDKSSDESMSSESTFNEDLDNIDKIQKPVLKKEQPIVKKEQSIVKKEQSIVKKEQPIVKNKPQNKEVDDKLLKVRQLLTLVDEKDYELENPRENKNYGYFGEAKPIAIEKNLTPLRVYIYGNYPHLQKSTTYYMLRKAGVEISNKLIGKFDMGIFWDPRMDINKQTPKLKQNGKTSTLIA